MNNLQLRLELQGSLQQWVNSTMQQFNISAAEMEDAMSRVLLRLKDQVLQDYLVEQQQAYQEAIDAASSDLIEEKEEDSGGSNAMN